VVAENPTIPDAMVDVFFADASDSGSGCPTPAAVSLYVPPAFVSPNNPSNACTQNQIQGFWDNCFDPITSSAQKCSTWFNANMNCLNCLMSDKSDSTWGPTVVSNSVVSLNVSGCVALQGDLTCAKKIQKLDGCTSEACDMQCPV